MCNCELIVREIGIEENKRHLRNGMRNLFCVLNVEILLRFWFVSFIVRLKSQSLVREIRNSENKLRLEKDADIRCNLSFLLCVELRDSIALYLFLLSIRMINMSDNKFMKMGRKKYPLECAIKCLKVKGD